MNSDITIGLRVSNLPGLTSAGVSPRRDWPLLGRSDDGGTDLGRWGLEGEAPRREQEVDGLK